MFVVESHFVTLGSIRSSGTNAVAAWMENMLTAVVPQKSCENHKSQKEWKESGDLMI